MKIAIIGVGNVGSNLARSAVSAGHVVTLAAAHPEKAQTVATQTGAGAAASPADAARGADLVVLAVPGTLAAGVVADLAPSLTGAVVVDATNPLDDTYTDLVIAGNSGAQAVQQAAGAVAVVKAFNTVFASRYAAPTEAGQPLQVLIAGDDTAAKERVATFAESIGFTALDAGGLRQARSLEEIAFLNITLNATRGWAWRSAFQLVGPTA